jgi:hypothetical protein
MFNVASASGLAGPIDQMYVRFEQAGFPEHYLPDDAGWMPRSAFPDQIVGRIAIRDALGQFVGDLTGREVSYSRAQKCNLMREGRVLERCAWPVQSLCAINVGSLQAIAAGLVHDKERRNRPMPTWCNSGSLFTGPQATTLVDR